ncbi:hypothetical protein BD65_620 [Yersinia ruckeri]|nr:hypothetical protein BD65_620 [Yersinia ruckeri]
MQGDSTQTMNYLLNVVFYMIAPQIPYTKSAHSLCGIVLVSKIIAVPMGTN